MPPPVTGSVATDSALHAAQFQPPPSNNSTSSTNSTSTKQDGTIQHAPTNPTIAETPASGITFIPTQINNLAVGVDPITLQPNAGISQLSNVIGGKTNTSGNSLINANGNQPINSSGNQLSNASGNQHPNPGGADNRPNIIVGIAKDQMSALLEEQGLRRGYFPHLARFPNAPVPGTVPRQMNSMAQMPINTQLLINNSRAVLRSRHATSNAPAFNAPAFNAPAYVADKDIDWLLDLSNLQGLPTPPVLEEVPRVITSDTPICIRMLESLGLNYFDNYVTHVTPSLTPSLYSTIKDPIKIPKTNGKLKAWMIAMRSAYAMVFPDIFKCLVQPDPVNNTNAQSHFQYLADNTSITDAAKFPDREITMYNYSSSVLAEAI
jgi:hypothetical protein